MKLPEKISEGVMFPANQDLAKILGRTDFDFENFHVWDLFGSQISGFPDFQISTFPGSHISKLLDFQVPRFPGVQTPPPRTNSQIPPDPSPLNKPKDQISRK